MKWSVAIAVIAANLVCSSSAHAGEMHRGVEVLTSALIKDFGQDGGSGDYEVLRAQYHEACLVAVEHWQTAPPGLLVACGADEWLEPAGSDLKVAAKLFERACDEGGPIGCMVIGWSLSQQKPGVFDPDLPTSAQAMPLFKKACDAGLPRACVDLATNYAMGVGTFSWSDPLEPARLLRFACDAGELAGCVRLGKMLQVGELMPMDYWKAVTLYEKACEGGHVAGCNSMGLAYELGVGGAKDPEMAMSFYWRACEEGHVSACQNLNRTFRYGVDLERAAPVYRMSCEGGHGLGCFRLGSLYLKGQGVEEDPAMAANFFRQACDGEHWPGCV
ncbi:MAG: sel1 repeat family protein, partial [Proteobacteria bacterium]|nr:sel1 repeat family protein [Pseudomonadota bacterium]